MALLNRNGTTTVMFFLVATAAMAMLFAPRSAYGQTGTCEHLPRCTIKSCRAMCKSRGFANTVVDCGKTGPPPGTALDNCCCYGTSYYSLRKLA